MCLSVFQRPGFSNLNGLVKRCVVMIIAALVPLAASAQQWRMFGGSIYRNNVHQMVRVGLDFDLRTGKNVLWQKKLGNSCNSSPIIGNGKVLISTNNSAGFRPQHPRQADRGVLICLEEKTGKFLWQLTRRKLATGRANDWPQLGMVSCACIDQDRAYVITNRAELMCLDLQGFADGKNDGPYQTEEDDEIGDADIIWSLDLIKELNVSPHNVSICSPVVYKDHVFAITGHGVNVSHQKVDDPLAPSFLCLNKQTGKIIWTDSSPGDNILHGQWSSPAIGVVRGKAQVCMPGGDGWVYSFDATAKSRKLLWKFDANPKKAQWKLGGSQGTRNNIIATPVFSKNSFVVGTGQDIEHGFGPAYLFRIDATRTGDISEELGPIGKPGKPNPNSGLIWKYGGMDLDGSVTGTKGEGVFYRTVSTTVIADGLVYVGDTYGLFHCVDFDTGQRQFVQDSLSVICGSPLVADGKVFYGTEDGDFWVLRHGRKFQEIKKFQLDRSIYTTPTIANGVLYLLDQCQLHAIDISQPK